MVGLAFVGVHAFQPCSNSLKELLKKKQLSTLLLHIVDTVVIVKLNASMVNLTNCSHINILKVVVAQCVGRSKESSYSYIN